MKHIAPESLPTLISGLLIGHEIRDAIAFFERVTPVHLIGKSRASSTYAKAFEHLGIEWISCEEDVHTAGIKAILAASLH